MRLFVLISTMGDGIRQVPAMLLPPQEGVTYVVVWQNDGMPAGSPDELLLRSRADVHLATMQGVGLCRSRNLAIATALGLLEHALEDAVFLIADDDERFRPDAFRHIMATYAQHKKLDLALFRLRSSADNTYFKPYPDGWVSYKNRPRSYYPCSWEMTMRSRVCQAGLRFDERFGLGAEKLCAGEEDVLLADAVGHGLRVYIIPEDIGVTDPHTTGDRVLDAKVLHSKGAVYAYTLPSWQVLLRCVREALSLSIRHRANAMHVFRNIWYGVKYIRQCPTN